jgi:hypothetical protein
VKSSLKRVTVNSIEECLLHGNSLSNPWVKALHGVLFYHSGSPSCPRETVERSLRFLTGGRI